MIKTFNNVDEFKTEITSLEFNINIDALLSLDFPFYDSQENYTVVSIKSYDESLPHNILVLSKSSTIILTAAKINFESGHYKKLLKKKNGETTVAILLILKMILKNYSREFEKIREKMNKLDLDPLLEEIEDSGRSLRRLTDRCEELVRLIILLKEDDVNEFDTNLISFDYELLNTEARYWLERCRSHIYRVASLRTKSEMKSNRELNDTMSRLTVIMTFLTIVSIVVSVPGTIGAIFGIPALSDTYFTPHTNLLVITLIIATLLSIFLGFIYWKSLGLKRNKS